MDQIGQILKERIHYLKRTGRLGTCIFDGPKELLCSPYFLPYPKLITEMCTSTGSLAAGALLIGQIAAGAIGSCFEKAICGGSSFQRWFRAGHRHSECNTGI